MPRRMFSTDIVSSDAFLEMPASSRELYFQLGMSADDDGFVNPKKIIRMVGASEDDIKILLSKRFVLPFESGVIVIKHWRMQNSLRKDRYIETRYREEKSMIEIKENGAYTELATIRQPSGNPRLPQVKLSKGNISKDKRERAPTPAEIARSFFLREERYSEIRASLLERIPEEVLDRELEKFVSYWTEQNKSGTKMRFEQQDTFEVRRRLQTWFSRVETDFKRQASRGRGFIN